MSRCSYESSTFVYALFTKLVPIIRINRKNSACENFNEISDYQASLFSNNSQIDSRLATEVNEKAECKNITSYRSLL